MIYTATCSHTTVRREMSVVLYEMYVDTHTHRFELKQIVTVRVLQQQ